MVTINLTKSDCDNRIKFHDGYWLHEEIDYSGLNDHEKFCLLVYSYSKDDMCVFRKTIEKILNWTTYKVIKIRKEVNESKSCWYIDCEAIFSEHTGLLGGKGYCVDFNLLK